ncbi:MAG: hypothetical protein KGK02_04670 [Rhodospirillales bacterium]|nr:hypothetical protein [Rhodospirillales bacterium]
MPQLNSALDVMPGPWLETSLMKATPQSPKLTRAEAARPAREEAEAAALRANLARRKAQARAKPDPKKDEPECP